MKLCSKTTCWAACTPKQYATVPAHCKCCLSSTLLPAPCMSVMDGTDMVTTSALQYSLCIAQKLRHDVVHHSSRVIEISVKSEQDFVMCKPLRTCKTLRFYKQTSLLIKHKIQVSEAPQTRQTASGTSLVNQPAMMKLSQGSVPVGSSGGSTSSTNRTTISSTGRQAQRRQQPTTSKLAPPASVAAYGRTTPEPTKMRLPQQDSDEVTQLPQPRSAPGILFYML